MSRQYSVERGLGQANCQLEGIFLDYIYIQAHNCTKMSIKKEDDTGQSEEKLYHIMGLGQ